MLKDRVKELYWSYMIDNLDKYVSGKVSASQKRILTTRFVGEAWVWLLSEKSDSIKKAFQRTGCGMSLRPDKYVRPQGLPEDYFESIKPIAYDAVEVPSPNNDAADDRTDGALDDAPSDDEEIPELLDPPPVAAAAPAVSVDEKVAAPAVPAEAVEEKAAVPPQAASASASAVAPSAPVEEKVAAPKELDVLPLPDDTLPQPPSSLVDDSSVRVLLRWAPPYDEWFCGKVVKVSPKKHSYTIDFRDWKGVCKLLPEAYGRDDVEGGWAALKVAAVPAKRRAAPASKQDSRTLVVSKRRKAQLAAVAMEDVSA